MINDEYGKALSSIREFRQNLYNSDGSINYNYITENYDDLKNTLFIPFSRLNNYDDKVKFAWEFTKISNVEELKKEFRKLANIFHPDRKNPNLTNEQSENIQKFIESLIGKSVTKPEYEEVVSKFVNFDNEKTDDIKAENVNDETMHEEKSKDDYKEQYAKLSGFSDFEKMKENFSVNTLSELNSRISKIDTSVNVFQNLSKEQLLNGIKFYTDIYDQFDVILSKTTDDELIQCVNSSKEVYKKYIEEIKKEYNKKYIEDITQDYAKKVSEQKIGLPSGKDTANGTGSNNSSQNEEDYKEQYAKLSGFINFEKMKNSFNATNLSELNDKLSEIDAISNNFKQSSKDQLLNGIKFYTDIYDQFDEILSKTTDDELKQCINNSKRIYKKYIDDITNEYNKKNIENNIELPPGREDIIPSIKDKDDSIPFPSEPEKDMNTGDEPIPELPPGREDIIPPIKDEDNSIPDLPPSPQNIIPPINDENDIIPTLPPGPENIVSKDKNKAKLQKALLGLSGFVVGYGLSTVPGVGTIRMTAAGIKLVGSGINLWTKKTKTGRAVRKKVYDPLHAEYENFKNSHPNISNGIDKLQKFLRNENVNLFVNGVSAGYMVGNIVELAKNWNLMEKLGFTDPTPDPIPEPIPDPTPEPIPEPIPDPTPDPIPEPIPEPIPDPTPIEVKVGDVLDISGIKEGYVYSGSENAVSLKTQYGKNVILDYIGEKAGVKWARFISSDGDYYAWFKLEDIQNYVDGLKNIDAENIGGKIR